ncbi:MAG: ribosome biogenesis GTP-binding protein YihA/YsxC [Proteobacteria bacterium]|nr:ribosome biogenesis GTP-binding protein YihA/YsxC [Pseudomonadota bacterium]
MKARFVTSAAKASDFPPPTHPEIAVVGRSNVGKSSLINALVGTDGLARTSRTPGRTRLLNWFEIESKHPFYLVDLPGYGYADVAAKVRHSWRPMIETYLESRTVLAGVLLLVDIRRGVQEEELDFVPWLESKGTPIVVALTKADKLSKNKRYPEIKRVRAELGITRDPYAVSTITDDSGIPELWKALFGMIDPKV